MECAIMFGADATSVLTPDWTDPLKNSVPSSVSKSSFTFDKLMAVTKLFHGAPSLLWVNGR